MQPKKKSAVKRSLRRDSSFDRCSLAMSRTESVLVSASGDVIVCRCRRSSTPYINNFKIDTLDAWTNLMPCCDADCISMGQGDNPWSPVFENLMVKQKNSGEQSQASEVSTYEWEKVNNLHLITREGLLGGAMQRPARKIKHHKQTVSPKDSAVGSMDDGYDGGILPLPSFDYSHIHEGHNDMVPPPHSSFSAVLATPNTARKKKAAKFRAIPESSTLLEPTSPEQYPEEKKDDYEEEIPVSPQFVHGVPLFLSTLSQIHITKVSAHPLGAHVLMISAEALLFTYGLNQHGQLGIGVKSNVKDGHRGFITTPTIVTPLLENGGKAINCAAGVDHSLVVVSTEGRRLHKLHKTPGVAYSDHGALAIARVTSSPSRLSYEEDEETIHAASSFENEESVLHHQLYGFGSNEMLKIGLVSASEDDADQDVLLPRRVALHCTVWPQNKVGSNGDLPPPGIFDIAASAEHSAALVRRATGDIEVYMWGNATLGALGLPVPLDSPRSNSNTQVPEASNIFPLPTVVESLSYRPSKDSSNVEFPVEVALGSYCSFVVMSTGRAVSFGFSAEGMLGQAFGITHTMEPKEVFLPGWKEDGIASISAGAHHAIAVTESGAAYSWGINSNDRLGLGIHSEFVKVSPNPEEDDLVVVEWVPQRIEMAHLEGPDSQKVVRACAGYDSSLLVVRSGQVLAFGKRSGRMGLGEVANDVNAPQSMFGGLHLFHNIQLSKRKPTKAKSLRRTSTSLTTASKP